MIDIELELGVSFFRFSILQELCSHYEVEYLRAAFYQGTSSFFHTNLFTILFLFL